MYRSAYAFGLAIASLLALISLTGCNSGPGPAQSPNSPSGLSSALNAISSALSSPAEPAKLGPNVARDASPGDDLYKPHSNVETEAAVALDAADIIRSASQGDL